MSDSGLPDGRIFPLRCLVFLTALLCGSALAFPQGKPRQALEFEVDQGRWALRSEAPVPLRLLVICSSPGILEGELEIQIVDNLGETIASILIPDLVYAPGRQEVEYLLPIHSHSMDTPLRVKSLFRVKHGGGYVSEGLLIPPPKRAFVVPIVREGEPQPGSDNFAWLTLESHCPKPSEDATLSPMLTQTPRTSPADLPRDPLKHMAHDIVVLEASGFNQLVGPQILALEAWVRAGGSLFLQIGAQDLSTEQQGFVDRLIAAQPNLLSDEVEGTQLIPIISQGKSTFIESGFGHVLLTTERSWAGASDADRQAAFGFLWRLQQGQLDSVRQTGMLTLDPVKKESALGWNAYGGYNNQSMAYQNQLQLQQAIDSENAGTPSAEVDLLRFWERCLLTPRSIRPNEMIQALMPSDVQAVPIWLLSLIILAYIAAIGLGDYLILGKLKRRRWTWFTFPAMTLAVSLLSIGTAKGYLGSSQQLNVVEYRDVADDGLITRIQRFELHFRSSPGAQLTPLDQMVYTPVSRQSVGGSRNPGYQELTDTQQIVIRGVPTQQAQAHQPLEQWRPQLNRTVSFPRNREAPLKLKPLKSGQSLSSPEYKTELISQIQQAFPNVVHQEIYLENGFSGLSSNSLMAQNPESHTALQLAMNCQPPNPASQQPQGVFSLFQQISPSADTGLADMVLASPHHQVLCVAVREPTGELVIYRWRVRVSP